MKSKGISIKKTTYANLQKCKIRENERNSQTIKRLLDKYEKELI